MKTFQSETRENGITIYHGQVFPFFESVVDSKDAQDQTVLRSSKELSAVSKMDYQNKTQATDRSLNLLTDNQ